MSGVLMQQRQCPALLIAAPASGQGKTTVTAALARLHCQQGRRVRVFKCGPDFLDPMILSHACGSPVESLDLWLLGEAECRQRLWQAAGEADLILIEGVMGLFDGNPSAADLARRFGVPVLAVIDGAAMAQTFGAIAHGLASFQPDLPFAGVLANRVGSARHGEILRDALPPALRWFGALPRSADIELPSRHLGLVQAAELADLDARLDAAAAAVAASAGSELPDPVSFALATPSPQPSPARGEGENPSLSYASAGVAGSQQTSSAHAKPLSPGGRGVGERGLQPLSRLLDGVRIGVARDAAFAFIYPANLQLLEQMGAELKFFSPLADTALPQIDSLYLPGGYPELHLQQLSGNQPMLAAIRAHHAAGKPLLAECGGMLYLLDQLTDLQGNSAALAGLLPGSAQMQPQLVALAMQAVELEGERMRGHSYHHSRMDCALQPLAIGECPNYKRVAEPVYRLGRLTASYIHFYLPSAPQAAAALLRP